jgi:hypothetical protein
MFFKNNFGQRSRIFSLPKRKDEVWGRQPLIQGLLGTRDNQDVNLTTHLHLQPRLRMSGEICLLPHTLLLRVEDNFAATLILSYHLCLRPPSGLFASGFSNNILHALPPPHV